MLFMLSILIFLSHTNFVFTNIQDFFRNVYFCKLLSWWIIARINFSFCKIFSFISIHVTEIPEGLCVHFFYCILALVQSLFLPHLEITCLSCYAFSERLKFAILKFTKLHWKLRVGKKTDTFRMKSYSRLIINIFS